MAQRISFVVEGVVQGVGFRYFTRQAAQEYGITGWCRNTPDDKVEGEAQGEDGPMAKFIADVQRGPRHSKVTNFTKKAKEVVEGESSFRVTR